MEKKIKKINLSWEIYNQEIHTIIRYCPNCGNKVEFKDSLKRRQNANGKNIYHLAIYKCPSGHTWNKDIGSFKTSSGLVNEIEALQYKESSFQELDIVKLHQHGLEEIHINLAILEKKIRLDKFLSTKLIGLSRGQIVTLITDGIIKVNSKNVKPKVLLKEKDTLSLLTSLFNL